MHKASIFLLTLAFLKDILITRLAQIRRCKISTDTDGKVNLCPSVHSPLVIQGLILIAALLLTDSNLLFAQNFAQGQAEPGNAFVLKDRVNIRAGKGTNFEIIGQLNKGNQVVVVAIEDDWYKIKLPKETASFVHQDYIEAKVVKADKLYVRAGKGTNFNVLGSLKKGETVNILEKDGQWLRIMPPDNCLGWVKKEFLQVADNSTALLKDKQVQAQGKINDLGKIFARAGTHKLVKDKKTIYYLKSEKFNLNLYVYQQVQVSGTIVNPQDSPYPVIDVEGIKVEQ